MPKVNPNQLTGNYGSALVAKRLSSECLVRPVAADTDVGVDLYCESLDDGEPFLHFWVQVKAGSKQVEEDPRKTSAKVRLDTDHLAYWVRQPVPVYIAMVPVSWPVKKEPNVYIADISSRVIMEGLPAQDTMVIESDWAWPAEDQESVKTFLSRYVPLTDARLMCRQGVVPPVKTLRNDYVRAVPLVPADRYQDKILDQLRQTAALSIYSMWMLGKLNDQTAEARRRLRDVLSQFRDDGHWENYMALGLSAHAERAWDTAVANYEKAMRAIGQDPKFAPAPGIDGLQSKIYQQLEHARNHRDVSS